MADDCCKLVGNLLLGLEGCVISVNVNSRTEIIKECNNTPLVGPSTGTVSITGYVYDNAAIHNGCPGRAGVSIPWVRRYDCDNDIVYMIPAGEGSSYLAGNVAGLAYLNTSVSESFTSISASSSSGPATVYMETSQTDGYGLRYDGGPISFDTGGTLIFANFGVGAGSMYLQNFSVEFTPGEVPVANYSFAFLI